ncbi:MAG: hypothetical protein IJY10_05210 [Lachnospiraceae bacterium]|nr:hypothetical protein [Lachnospiraceae bacterium]
MREKHLLRTGKIMFLIQIITTIFLMVGLMSQLMLSGLPPILSIIPIVTNVLVFFSSLVIYIKNKGSDFYFTYVGIAFSILYVLILLTSQGNATFPYMIPYLIALMLSMKKGIVLYDCLIFLVINIVKVVTILAGASNPTDVIETIMIETIITITTTIIIIKGVSLVIRFFEEFSSDITDTSNKNIAIIEQMVKVTEKVETSAGTAQETIGTVSEQSSVVSAVMTDMSEGINSIVDAIQQQTKETQSIQNIISNTEEQSRAIAQIAQTTQDGVNKGADAMESLLSNVKNSISEGEQMKEAASLLKEKSGEVRGITNVIMNISSKTNLLALNASIEAARAGEAGRGFAVVAEEIRSLAEQTKQETENIATLLDELAVDTETVSAKVEQTVAISLAENDLALEANEQFSMIKEKSAVLVDMISDIAEKLRELMTANASIVDSVNTLSASSEEISASTTESCDICERNVTLVNEFKELLDEIVVQVDSLRSTMK